MLTRAKCLLAGLALAVAFSVAADQFPSRPTFADVIANSGTVRLCGTTTGKAALCALGTASNWALLAQANSTVGQSFGAFINGGTNASDIAFGVSNQSGALNFFKIDGAGNITAPNAASAPWTKTAACWIIGTSSTPAVNATRGGVSCSGIAKNSTGNYTLSFGAGFTNRPMCTFSPNPSGQPATLLGDGASGTGSSVSVLEANTSGVATDGDFMAICSGT